MSFFSWLLSSPVVERLGWTLIHSVWEGAAAAMVLGLFLGSALRRASARRRYVACSGALAVLIAGLGVTFSLVRVSNLPRESEVIANAPAYPLNGGEMGRKAFESGPAVLQDLHPTQIAVADASLQDGSHAKPASPPSLALRPAFAWLCGIWACGVFLLSLFHIVSFIGIQRLRALGTSAVEESITLCARRLAAQLGIRRSVMVLRSLYARTPMVIGWLRPVILVPAAVASGLPARQIELILAHELAHVRRHDYIVNLLQVMAETLLFYHPAVWWISKRIRLERELCCDEAAVAVCGGDRCGYVESLAALEELRGAELAMAAVGSGGGELLARARRLLGAGDEVGRRGARVGLAVAGIVCLVLLMVVIRLHAAPAVEKPVDAAALVREVRETEGWVEKAKSLRLKVELVWHGDRKLEDASSDKVPPRNGRELSLDLPETIEMGFDDHRLYFRADAQEYELIRHFTWDGKVAVSHEKYSPRENSQEHYVLEKEPWLIGRFFMGELAWPRAGPHQYWWVRNRGLGDQIYGGKPEDFHMAGREKFRGVECYVLESDVFYRTFYVGVADHRLYGLTNRVLMRFAGKSRASIGQEIAKDMGHEVKDSKELDVWLNGLSPAQRDRFQTESFKRMRRFTRPDVTYWYEDYTEAAPGCWLPMHQGYDLWEATEDPTAEPKIRKTHDMKILEATVNPALPDQWFVWEFREGVEMADRRNDPVLLYKYKKHFEPAEWQAIVDEANQQKARHRPGSDNPAMQVEMQVRAIQAVLGKPAPEFPAAAQWINSKPLKMAELKGKMVIIECFASWSKFSLEDIAKLNDRFEHGQEGTVVIGVHAAGTPVEDVRKWVKENGVKYPVCIDTPGDKGPWEGAMFNAYHVMNLPERYVINGEGIVRSQGGTSIVETPRKAPTQTTPADGAKTKPR